MRVELSWTNISWVLAVCHQLLNSNMSFGGDRTSVHHCPFLPQFWSLLSSQMQQNLGPFWFYKVSLSLSLSLHPAPTLVCVCVCVCVWHSGCVWRLEDSKLGCCSCSFHLDIRSLVCHCVHQASWAVSFQSFSCLCLLSYNISARVTNVCYSIQPF